jgi:SAM-dependent methyltransferase
MIDLASLARNPVGAAGIWLAREMAVGHRHLYDLVLTELCLVPGECVLEVGCGLAVRAPDFNRRGICYVGVDRSADVIFESPKYCGVLIHGDIATVVLPKIDAAFSVNVMQWLDDPVAALIAVREALVVGGKFVVGTPDSNCPRRPYVPGLSLYSGIGLAGVFRQSGFCDVSVRSVETKDIRYLVGSGMA